MALNVSQLDLYVRSSVPIIAFTHPLSTTDSDVFVLSADPPRSGILGSADPRTSRPKPRMTKPRFNAPF